MTIFDLARVLSAMASGLFLIGLITFATGVSVLVIRSIGQDTRAISKSIAQTPLSLLRWFIKTAYKGTCLMPRFLRKAGVSRRTMIIHGDTLSTVLGALLGKLFT